MRRGSFAEAAKGRKATPDRAAIGKYIREQVARAKVERDGGIYLRSDIAEEMLAVLREHGRVLGKIHPKGDS